MKFNHLNVPTHWQNYWTRYPEGHTILEALISWVSQVDSMVDNQNNLNDTVAQFRNEIDEFVGRFDELLQVEVKQTLQDWQASGFIDVVISEALQWQLTDYIATNEADKLSIATQLDQKNDLGYFLGIKNFDGKYVERKSYEYYDLYDGLLSDVRLSKTTLGLDQSNLLPINLYTYTPSNYEKTIFITCAIHGWEHYGTFLMYNILKSLIHDGDLPTQFAHLRETRLLIIPVANPWGLDSTEHLGIRRGNVQGVDINRNFDHNWINNEGAYGLTKGSAPFSEKESQYIKHVFDNYDIDFYVDLHNFNDTPENVKDYEFNGYDSIATNTVEFITWLERRYPNSNVNHVKTTINSSANNYASQVLSVPAMNLEMVSGRYGLDDERKWYELVINYLAFQARTKTVSGTKVFTGLQHAGMSSVPTSWTDLDFYKAFYKVENDGMFIFNGYLTLTFVGEAIVTIAPEFYQSQGKELKLITGADRFKPMLKVKDGVYTLPYTFIYPAKKMDGDAYFNLKIIKEGTGTVNFFRIGKASAFLPGNLVGYDNLQLVP